MGEDRMNPNLGRQGTRIEICLWIGLIALAIAIGLINNNLFESRDKSSLQPENEGSITLKSGVC